MAVSKSIPFWEAGTGEETHTVSIIDLGNDPYNPVPENGLIARATVAFDSIAFQRDQIDTNPPRDEYC